MEVSINKDSCIGCEQCVSICENVFYMGDGTAEVKPGCISSGDYEKVKEACDSCPVNAIIVNE